MSSIYSSYGISDSLNTLSHRRLLPNIKVSSIPSILRTIYLMWIILQYTCIKIAYTCITWLSSLCNDRI